MLYTRQGDNGTTKLFDCKSGERISKSEPVFEVLGTLDELNSSIGYAKALARKNKLSVGTKYGKEPYAKILETFQQNLFCIQAELGGALISATRAQVSFLEEIIYEIETLLPPIKSFIVPGGGEVGASLDVARTVARRAERGCVALIDMKPDQGLKSGDRRITCTSLEFLNRLSSALYALARFANYQEGYSEQKPTYS